MQRILIIALSILWACQLKAQDFTGEWQGALDVNGLQYRLVLHMEEKEGELSATLDSPDQQVKGMLINTISFQDNTLKFEMTAQQATFTGKYVNDSFEGTWTQGGGTLPITFKRQKLEKKVVSRPQEPQGPFPYDVEEVTFHNPDFDINLAGTITKPEGDGPFPAIILISGSGAQDRDETLAGHKPFWVLADYMSRRGIAVLRFDDRGVAKSEGDYSTATTADLATDAKAAVEFLAGRSDVREIGLMGHSEGGIIAPIVAAEHSKVDFIVLLAGTGIPGEELLLMQSEAIMAAQGMAGPMLDRTMQINQGIFSIIKNNSDPANLKDELGSYVLAEIPEAYRQGMSDEEFVDSQVGRLLSPWMQYFIKYNPALILEDVDCPVLAVNGDKDLQVPAEANLTAIAAALKKGGNSQVTTSTYPGLNHLFQKTETGLPSEYGTLEETFSEEVMKDLAAWIKKTTK